MAAAAEFPLEFKPLTAEKVRSVPGVSGSYTSLTNAKVNISSVPEAKSGKPLYGTLGGTTKESQWVLMLDESKGTGKGYDVLYLDVNHNGDLTDDAPVAAQPLPAALARTPTGSTVERTFGPIQAPVSRSETQSEVMPIFVIAMVPATSIGSNYFGYAMVLPGSLLEAKVSLNGVEEKIALVDANANLRYGDPPKRQEYKAPTASSSYRYFSTGDVVLRDRNGSGEFEEDLCDSESEDFASLMYFGGKPYTAKIDADQTSIELEPYDGPMGELTSDNFDYVKTLSLEWKKADGSIELISVQPVNGLLKAPVGQYGLYRCVLRVDDPKTGPVMARGMRRTLPDWVSAGTGQSAALRFGAPLELRVTAERPTNAVSTSGEGGGNFLQALSDVFTPSGGSGTSVKASPEVRINVEVRGTGDETYDMYLKGGSLTDRAMPPKFKVLDANQKVVASGQLEYG